MVKQEQHEKGVKIDLELEEWCIWIGEKRKEKHLKLNKHHERG